MHRLLAAKELSQLLVISISEARSILDALSSGEVVQLPDPDNPKDLILKLSELGFTDIDSTRPLNELQIEHLQLNHTGLQQCIIRTSASYSDAEIAEYLSDSDYRIADGVIIDTQSGGAVVIEDDELARACIQFLERRDQPPSWRMQGSPLRGAPDAHR